MISITPKLIDQELQDGTSIYLHWSNKDIFVTHRAKNHVKTLSIKFLGIKYFSFF